MSSGTPESSGHSPKDWQSPYGSQGGNDAYGGPASPYGQGGYDQYGGRPPYDQQATPAQGPYDQQLPPGQGPYDPYATPAQGPYEQQYGAPAQGPYDQQYGTPPQGGPYDQQQYGAPGQQPYDQQYGAPGQQPYGQQYGYGPYQQNPYGYPPRPVSEGPRSHAIVALVISILLALSCYISLGGIAGVILSGIALGKVDTEPQQARSLLRWCWIAIGINFGLVVLGIGAAIVISVAGG
ncbi:DUF4190 domain-containing protein [Sphaerisporangium perillae]|uniref:DUF4190 domain-containing protein n=1 Tax=Sphaerisporangium perillae TaxID=2935860 RepID=UPI00200D0CB7|nr:DUF4190 domain-containing protein [Sphaerisporangium perillae]